MKAIDYLLVDFISPSGHGKINNYFVENLIEEKYTVTVLAKKNYSFMSPSNFIIFHTLFENDSQAWRHYLEQVIFSFISLLINIRTVIAADKIVFLSYDNVVNIHLFILLKYFFKKEVYVIEHNTVNEGGSGIVSYIKRVARQAQALIIKSIVFEEYIGRYLQKVYGFKYTVVSHPIILSLDEGGAKCRFDIFSPSGSTPFDVHVFLSKYSVLANASVCVKDEGIETFSELFIQKRYFDDYDTYMLSAKIIIIGAEFEYRVSGVFYEALATSAYIVMKKCKFSINVIKKFPEKIRIYDDFSELKVLLNGLMISDVQPEPIDLDLFNIQSSLSLIKGN